MFFHAIKQTRKKTDWDEKQIKSAAYFRVLWHILLVNHNSQLFDDCIELFTIAMALQTRKGRFTCLQNNWNTDLRHYMIPFSFCSFISFLWIKEKYSVCICFPIYKAHAWKNGDSWMPSDVTTHVHLAASFNQLALWYRISQLQSSINHTVKMNKRRKWAEKRGKKQIWRSA